MAVDTNNQLMGLQLELFDKKGELVAQGDSGSNKVILKGIKPEDLKAGDYQVAFTDGVSVSPMVDVPAITDAASK